LIAASNKPQLLLDGNPTLVWPPREIVQSGLAAVLACLAEPEKLLERVYVSVSQTHFDESEDSRRQSGEGGSSAASSSNITQQKIEAMVASCDEAALDCSSMGLVNEPAEPHMPRTISERHRLRQVRAPKLPCPPAAGDRGAGCPQFLLSLFSALAAFEP
jgi:hypothetical protein